MAKLTTGARKRLPGKDFAGPDRSFPMENRSHAIAAERDVGRAEAAGHISVSEGNKIKAKARKKLGDANLNANDGRGGYSRTKAKQTAVRKALSTLKRRGR